MWRLLPQLRLVREGEGFFPPPTHTHPFTPTRQPAAPPLGPTPSRPPPPRGPALPRPAVRGRPPPGPPQPPLGGASGLPADAGPLSAPWVGGGDELGGF